METNFNKDNMTKLFEMAGWAVTVALQVSQLFRLGVQSVLHKTRDELMALAATGQRAFAVTNEFLQSLRTPKPVLANRKAAAYAL